MNVLEEIERAKEISGQVERLTGLTVAQLRDLQLAGSGALRKMGGPRLHYMRALIGPDMRCTSAGYAMLLYIEMLADNSWYMGPREAVEIDGRKPGLPTHGPTIKMRPVHWKLIGALWNDGCLSERWIYRIYGARVFKELLLDGFVQSSERPNVDGWRVWRLTSLGNMFAQDLGA